MRRSTRYGMYVTEMNLDVIIQVWALLTKLPLDVCTWSASVVCHRTRFWQTLAEAGAVYTTIIDV